MPCDQRNQRVNVESFRVCSRRPFSLEEMGLDQSAPATWLNSLSNVGKAAAGGKGKHTVAAESLVSVIGVSVEVQGEVQVKEVELKECVVRASRGSPMTCDVRRRASFGHPRNASRPLFNLYSFNCRQSLRCSGSPVEPWPNYLILLHPVHLASADHGGACWSARERHLKRPKLVRGVAPESRCVHSAVVTGIWRSVVPSMMVLVTMAENCLWLPA